MKRNNMTFFMLDVIFFVVFLFVLPFETSISKAISYEMGSYVVTDTKSGEAGLEPVVFINFELISGLEIIESERRRFVQLGNGSKKGRAENYFFEQSGKYDITLFYADNLNEKSEVKLIINNQNIGSIILGSSNLLKEKTITGINVQQWSKIALEFTGDGDDKARFEKLVFNPIGAFDGKADNLVKPVTLRIFETQKDQLTGQQVFTNYVKTRTDSLTEKRKSELATLKDPAEWKARQVQIREQFKKYFGEFPERTPLEARIVGKLDRKGYTIEKVIYESQPNYYVTANLYIPKDRKFPLPGVIFTCGHHVEAKAFDEYQMTCSGLALKGYVVLIFDPTGQGERIEYFNPQTKKSVMVRASGTGIHHQIGRPAFLVDWTLSGLRTWDAIRSVDYLVSRPEVDKDKLAAVGQSGGGQMALLITAVDERIKVCAASHPGGSMEDTYLPGRTLINKDILSLIPPRPLRIIVGKDSGEEPGHMKKLEDMHLFYEGLRAGKQSGDMDIVPGVHTMNRSNRQSAYEWFNKWLDKESEGKAEGMVEAETIEALWCTETGNTIVSLGGETGQSLNMKRAEQIYKPEMDLAKLKERVATRIGFDLPQNRQSPGVSSIETIKWEDLSVEKLTYESEKGIIIPSLLIKPNNVKPDSPVYIYASDKGKPKSFENAGLPFLLAKNGFIVLAIDVRGIGETSPTLPFVGLTQYTGVHSALFVHDALAIESAGFGRTTLGMRTYDAIRGIDFLNSREDLKGKKTVLIGEGLGGLWALLASGYDSRIAGAVTIGTLPSYKELITNQYYFVWGYFWVPGAMRDFDIPDLTRLVSPKPQIWINPVNAMGESMNSKNASSIIGSQKNLNIISQAKESSKEIIQKIITTF